MFVDTFPVLGLQNSAYKVIMLTYPSFSRIVKFVDFFDVMVTSFNLIISRLKNHAELESGLRIARHPVICRTNRVFFNFEHFLRQSNTFRRKFSFNQESMIVTNSTVTTRRIFWDRSRSVDMINKEVDLPDVSGRLRLVLGLATFALGLGNLRLSALGLG